MESLTGVREKIIRAQDHLDAFDAEIATYKAANPYSIIQQFEDHIPEKSGRPGLTWRAHIDPPLPTLRLAVIAGDVLHCLRSALDHLAWALVLENDGVPSSDSHPKTQFPILSKPPVTIRAKEGGITKAAETILAEVQPYSGGQDPTVHSLKILSRLSNVDKHRTLNFVAIDFGRVVMKFSDGRTKFARRLHVEEGRMIVWTLEEDPDFDPNVKVEAEFSPSIAFRDALEVGTEPSMTAHNLLLQLLEFTRDDVVQRFSNGCFGGPLNFGPPAS